MRESRTVKILFILPVILIMGILVLYPFFKIIHLSFYNVSTLTFKQSFNGLQNYFSIVRNPEFLRSLYYGTIYAISSTFLQLILGTGVAMLLNKPLKGRSIARALILVPYGIPVVVLVGIWTWLLNDLVGIVNWVLIWMGIIKVSPSWLGDPTLAMIALISVSVYKWFPFVTFMVLARLQVVQKEVYEAAAIDGTSGFQEFWYITLPLLKQILFIVLLVRFIWMFNKFDVVNIYTGGGPAGRTQNLPLLTYETSFGYYLLGEGACLGVFALGILTVFAYIYMRELKPHKSVGY